MDRSKVASGQSHHIGTEWHSLDWGSSYPAPVPNPATSLHANSESFGIFSFRAVNHIRGFAETPYGSCPRNSPVGASRCDIWLKVASESTSIHRILQRQSCLTPPTHTVSARWRSLVPDCKICSRPKCRTVRFNGRQSGHNPEATPRTPRRRNLTWAILVTLLRRACSRRWPNFRPQVLRASYNMFTAAKRQTSMNPTLTKRYCRNGLRLSENNRFTC